MPVNPIYSNRMKVRAKHCYGVTRMLINDPSVIPVVADPANVDLWAPIAEKADVGVLKKQT